MLVGQKIGVRVRFRNLTLTPIFNSRAGDAVSA